MLDKHGRKVKFDQLPMFSTPTNVVYTQLLSFNSIRQRKKQDAIERKRRAEERTKMIQRANDLIYSQTDKMKQVT